MPNFVSPTVNLMQNYPTCMIIWRPVSVAAQGTHIGALSLQMTWWFLQYFPCTSYRVGQKSVCKSSGLLLGQWLSNAGNSFWYELHLSAILEINQIKQKYCSFFNELRSFLPFLGTRTHQITLICSASCLAALKLHISWKNGIYSYSDDWDIEHWACIH